MQRITSKHAEHYHEHGYAIVENFLTASELAGAREEIRETLPGWVEFCDDPSAPKPTNSQFNFTPGRGAIRFPYTGSRLNHISMHPDLVGFAREQAGGNEVFCEQANLNVKCQGHPRDQDQAMHCDFGNHTLAYPPNLPEYWQTAYIVYFTEVTEKHAPTAVCSWQHYPENLRWPSAYKREDRPALYDNEVKVIVPAGGLLMYSMRTFHRGTPFLADVGRIVEFITYAPAAWKWLGITGWSVEAIRPEFREWIEAATPQERELLGFPPPGHAYWTDETREGVSARYPEMDMTPYL
ncbi:MAG: phytanoyl-CoA dioxygenase family protein [Pseudomonadota bacterium]